MQGQMNLDEIVRAAVGVKIKKDMEMVSRALHSNVKTYSYIFDGDILQTQKVLIESCFPKDKPILQDLEDKEELYFDMDWFLSNVPDEFKEKLYQKMIERLASDISLFDPSE